MQETNKKSYDVGVIVGRFQVHDLHDGHKEILNHIQQHHQKMLVIIGSSPVPGTTHNPLDLWSRTQMIKDYYPDAYVLGIMDQASDYVWSKNLDNLIHGFLMPMQTAVLYGSRDSFISHYHGTFDAIELVGDPNNKCWSGSEVRENIRKSFQLYSKETRAAMIWQSYNRFPTVYSTVDIACTKLELEDRWVLVGRKPNENKWRFIGGFVDVRDKCLENAASREFREETGGEVAHGPMTYIYSTEINDWRYRKSRDKIMTTFFHTEFSYGQAKPSDDIAELTWKKLSALNEDDMVGEHGVLLNVLQDHFDNNKKKEVTVYHD